MVYECPVALSAPEVLQLMHYQVTTHNTINWSNKVRWQGTRNELMNNFDYGNPSINDVNLAGARRSKARLLQQMIQ